MHHGDGGFDFHNANRINGKAFDMNVPMFAAAKGQYERWVISGEGDMMLHPFHIHGTQFRILSETNEMVELSGMIYRQFRLLIQAREILDEGGSSRQVEKELRVLPFVADKLTGQARRFSMKQLLDVFGRLLQIDEDMKSGGMPGEVAFELLIADLTA